MQITIDGKDNIAGQLLTSFMGTNYRPDQIKLIYKNCTKEMKQEAKQILKKMYDVFSFGGNPIVFLIENIREDPGNISK